MGDAGYIYVKNWKTFQHPDVVRGGGVRMPWIRDYVDQLDNDAYLALPLAYRAGLQDIRRLVAATGNGRCSARADYLQKRCSWPAGWSQKILKRLSDEGFIEVRASKMRATRVSRGEERRYSIKKKNARKAKPVADMNGNHPETDRPLTPAERKREAQDALARIHTLPTQDIA